MTFPHNLGGGSATVLWTAPRGVTVRGVMGLDAKQAERTLTDYASDRCEVCGVMGVNTHLDAEGRRSCSLCDSPVEHDADPLQPPTPNPESTR